MASSVESIQSRIKNFSDIYGEGYHLGDGQAALQGGSRLSLALFTAWDVSSFVSDTEGGNGESSEVVYKGPLVDPAAFNAPAPSSGGNGLRNFLWGVAGVGAAVTVVGGLLYGLSEKGSQASDVGLGLTVGGAVLTGGGTLGAVFVSFPAVSVP